MALLTLDNLATVMGRESRPYEGDEIGPAQLTLDIVEAYILTRCPGLAFEETTVTDEKMQADYSGIIEIRKYPISDITSVKNFRDNTETCWDWDDWDTIFDLCPFETVLVSYVYGFDAVPSDLLTVAKSLAYRQASNPLNVRQQTVGAISETYADLHTNSQEDAILDKYAITASSLRLGPQTGRNIRRLPTL
jgi:hypothetical protein